MPTPSLILVPARFKTGKLYTPVATTTGALVLGASGDFNVTRATNATRVNASGLIESVASGIPRLDYFGSSCPALLVEPAATNLALHSRDLTNAVWSGTTVTTAKNAVGADGTASGATTITATAASGTVLQALSHASQSRVFSAYIRRVSGTGAIQLTTNGGTNWDTVTITSGYTLVASEARTVASGTVGIRLAASGDVIEVDYAQGEVGPVATSRIPTTISSVTRNADVITIDGAVSGCIGQTEGTIYVDIIPPLGGTGTNAFFIGDGTSSNFVYLGKTGANLQSVIRSDNITRFSNTSFALTGNAIKAALGYKSGDFALYANGSIVASGTTAFTFTSGLTRMGLSSGFNFLAPDVINRYNAAVLYPNRLSNSELIALTTP